jgi:hypothetical protein
MKRLILAVAALASLAFATAPSPASAADVGLSIRIGDPYPEYRGGYVQYRSEPDIVLVPRTRVYYVRNYDRDLYRYGNMWYLVDDGYWYRSRSYRGPFIRVSLRTVPREIYSVPTRYRRSWGTATYNTYGRDYNRDWRWEQDRDRRYGDRYRNRSRHTRDGNWDRDRDRDRDGNWDRDRDRGDTRYRGDVRTREMIDRNNDGIDDRDQTPDQMRDRDRRDRDSDGREGWHRDRDGNWVRD